MGGRLTGQLVPLADIQIQGGGETQTVRTNGHGQYSVELPAGRYGLVVQNTLYSDGRFNNVRVQAGQTITKDLTLEPFVHQPITVTVEPAQLDGQDWGNLPGTAFGGPAQDIVQRVTTNPSDPLVVIPGVDIIKPGVQTVHVVLRSFNNIFSGALHMLTDYRLAGGPSLRVNLMHFISLVDEDIDRIEVVLGMNSALYGPKTANGIVHFITKYPLQSQGTTMTLRGGARSVGQGAFRSAFLLNDDLRFKISGQYMRGRRLELHRPQRGGGPNCRRRLPRRVYRGQRDAWSQPRGGRDRVQPARRPGLRRGAVEPGGEGADYRFPADGTVVGTYGRNTSSGIELTGLGAGQTYEWASDFFQARVRKGRFFGQAYYNTSDAGDSFLSRDRVALVDQSALCGAQAQHGFTLADDRQEFTYGGDDFATRPDSRGTI